MMRRERIPCALLAAGLLLLVYTACNPFAPPPIAPTPTPPVPVPETVPTPVAALVFFFLVPPTAPPTTAPMITASTTAMIMIPFFVR